MPEEEQTSEPTKRRGRRTGGRAGRAAARQAAADVIEREPYLTRTLAPIQMVSDEHLEIIEHNADTVLEQAGLEFREFPEALDLLRDHGCDVDGERVRFPRGLCRQIIKDNAPSIYTQHARNPKNSVKIGGMHTVFVPNYGSPFAFDLDKGRRYATIEDFRNIVKLTHMTPYIHHSGGTVVEPTDIAVNKRHLDMIYSHIKYGEKPFMGSVTARENAVDSIELARMAFGGDLEDRTVMSSLINAASPMVWDATMLGALTEYARANQAVIVSPFILAGAMSPTTTAGVATQTLAEALAGMAYAQMVRPGAPVIFGSFASSMSMATGAPTFGTPEPALVLYTVAALARRLGVPFRSGGSFTASKLPDAQAAYESANTLMPTVLGGVNFALHSAGWQEGGLSFGFEKFIMDVDQLGMMHKFVGGVDMSENGLALNCLLENGPGQHFLGTDHTLKNFETAFYRSNVSNNDSFEQWEIDGSLSAAQRANSIFKKQLAEYEPPALDEAIDDEMLAYIAQRKDSMPDAFG